MCSIVQTWPSTLDSFCESIRSVAYLLHLQYQAVIRLTHYVSTPKMPQPLIPATSYIPPSVSDHTEALHSGESYTHFTPLPPNITPNTPDQPGTPCVLGIDEAGRGPVIGPMVYGLFYLPLDQHEPLLSTTHSFNDSKQLTPLFRAQLMHKLCTPNTDLFNTCGWATTSLSARAISAGMLRPRGRTHNLNAQATDATVALVRGALDRGVNVAHVYVDTIGQPAAHQRRLERVFPATRFTVAKKADALFPVVSAASVVAKVTRDVSCEVLYARVCEARREERHGADVMAMDEELVDEAGWGSGYPSDAKCVTWMRGSMDGLFGWGAECRFSWGTVKDMLEAGGGGGSSAAAATGKGYGTGGGVRVEWPDDDEADEGAFSQYFAGGAGGVKGEAEDLRGWYGRGVKEIF